MNSLFEEIRLALYQVWNRRWLALGIAWAICLLGWLIVSMIPNSYESKARIVVQSPDVLSSDMGAAGAQNQRKDADRLEKTLTSTLNLEKVVRQTNLGKNVTTNRDLAVAVEGLRKNIKVTNEKENVFEITATLGTGNMSEADAAQTTRDVVQKLIDIFQEENIASGRLQTNDTLRFLDQQLEERRKSLQEAEQARIDFETQNLGMLPGADSATSRMSMVRTESQQVDSQLIQAQSSLAALNGQIAGTPATITTTIPGVTTANPAAAQLAGAKGELAAMRARGLTDAHPDVMAQKRQISALQSAGSGGSSTSSATSYQQPNPAYSSLISMRSERQAQVAALQARKSSLDAEIARLSGKLAAEPGVSAEYDRLTREYDVKKEQYEKLMTEREKVSLRGDISSETDAVTFNVTDPPSTPLKPVAPNRVLLLIGVLLVGIVGGIGTALALGQLQSSFSSPAKLERAAGLPVLGSISLMLSQKEASERKRYLTYFYGAAASLVGVFCLLMVIQAAGGGSLV